MFERFDRQAMTVVSLARGEARLLGYPAIGTEHLFLALLNEHLAQAGGVLRSALPPAKEVRQVIGTLHPAMPGASSEGPVFTEPALTAIGRAGELAAFLGQEQVSAFHIATVLLDEDAGVLKVLGALGVDPQTLRVAVKDSGPDASPPSATASW